MTKISPAQRCDACGKIMTIPELATGFVEKGADYVCLACGRCYGWSDTQPPTLRSVDPPDIPQPPLQKG